MTRWVTQNAGVMDPLLRVMETPARPSFGERHEEDPLQSAHRLCKALHQQPQVPALKMLAEHGLRKQDLTAT